MVYGLKALSLLAFFLLFSSGPVQAGDVRASCEEAKMLTKKAAEFLRLNGLEKSYQAFQDASGPFQKNGLYVFIINNKGVMVVHPITPSLQHRNILEMTDVMGFPMGKSVMNVKNEQWMHYKYPRPDKVDLPKNKSSYIINVDGYRVGCGCYPEEQGE